MFWIIIVACVIGFCLGLLEVFAGGMSDAPYEGEKDARNGFILQVICVIIVILACVARHNGWLPV